MKNLSFNCCLNAPHSCIVIRAGEVNVALMMVMMTVMMTVMMIVIISVGVWSASSTDAIRSLAKCRPGNGAPTIINSILLVFLTSNKNCNIQGLNSINTSGKCAFFKIKTVTVSNFDTKIFKLFCCKFLKETCLIETSLKYGWCARHQQCHDVLDFNWLATGPDMYNMMYFTRLCQILCGTIQRFKWSMTKICHLGGVT